MLTTTEAAVYLRQVRGIDVKIGTIKQWCRRGKFPHAHCLGNRIWQIPQSDLDAFEQMPAHRPKIK